MSGRGSTGKTHTSPVDVGLRDFVRALIHESPGGHIRVIAVQVAAGLTGAIGVLLLVPLLGAVGVGRGNGLERWLRGLFHTIGERPTLTAVISLYVVVIAISAVLGARQSILSTRYRLEFVDRLRSRLYGAVAHAEWRHLMSVRQADVMTVLTANVNAVGTSAQAVLSVVSNLVVVSGLLVAAALVSPLLTAFAIATGIALQVVIWPLVRRSRRIGAELVVANRAVGRRAAHFLAALKLAKAFGREDAHVTSFKGALATARALQIDSARASAYATAVQTALTALLLGVVVDVAFTNFHVPIRSLLVVALVFSRVVAQLTSTQGSCQQVAQGLPAFEEITALMASCESMEEAPPATRGRLARIGIGAGLCLDDVRFAYPQGAIDRPAALRGVSLEIPAGSMLALAGPSGAGKTTIADLIAGLIMPTAGEVRIGGHPLTPDSVLGWRRSLAMVPQDPFLFHDTIRANLLWACGEATENELWEALRMAAVADFVEQLPERLDAIVGDRGMRLSGGERQRIALARALLRRPDLLILDEATSSLDTESERAIRTALADLRGQTTVLVIAHRLAAATEADQIAVLDAGLIVETGNFNELSALPMGRLQSLIAAGSTAVLSTAAS